jgi:hypothetical protein
VADLREGIHRALGHGPNPFGGSLNPAQEYNREMTQLFSQFLSDVTALTGHAFQTVTITADGADLKAGGLARPAPPGPMWSGQPVRHRFRPRGPGDQPSAR